MNRVIIYHDDADGRCAAAIAGRYHVFREAPEVVYIPMLYEQALPWDEIGALRFEKDEIWVVDFSLPREDMLQLSRAVGRAYFHWFDHHKTALEELADLNENDCTPMVSGLRDSGVAACLLVWIWCNKGEEAPGVVKYIADRDMWEFKYGDQTKCFYEMYLMADNRHPSNMVWDTWFRMNDEDYKAYLETGAMLRRARYVQLRSVAEKYGYEQRWVVSGDSEKGEPYRTLKVNYPGSGDMGEVIRRMGYDVAWCWVEKREGNSIVRVNTLYSNVVDVSEFAKKAGGGGHKEAAGFVERLT